MFFHKKLTFFVFYYQNENLGLFYKTKSDLYTF